MADWKPITPAASLGHEALSHEALGKAAIMVRDAVTVWKHILPSGAQLEVQDIVWPNSGGKHALWVFWCSRTGQEWPPDSHPLVMGRAEVGSVRQQCWTFPGQNLRVVEELLDQLWGVTVTLISPFN